MNPFLYDLRYAVRALRRNPGFSTVVVATLALAIGANSAIFSVVETVILRPLPYRDAARLVRISDAPDQECLYGDFEAWKSQSRSFQDLAVWYKNSGVSRATLTGSGEPESVQGGFVSANVFSLLGVSPSFGRFFSAEEEKRADRVVLLSTALWKRRFGGAMDVLGKTLEIDGVPSRIAGVMPVEFQLPAKDTQFWAPITTNRLWGDPALVRHDPGYSRGFYARWQAIGRLRPGVKLAPARAEIAAIHARLRQSDPRPYRGDGAHLAPLHVDLKPNVRLGLLILLGAVSFVLLIACTNVANLVLARGASRQREIAVRAALGAGRGRLVRQLFTESLVLAAAGGLLGLVLARFGIRALVASGPPEIPRLEEASIDAGVLIFLAGASLFSAVLFGLAPAWKITRSDLQVALRRRRADARRILVVGECALSVVLLTGAGLLARSLGAVLAVDPGFQTRSVLAVHLGWPAGTSAARQRSFQQEVFQRLRTMPQVQSAGAIDQLFEFGEPNILGLRAIAGRELTEPRGRWSELIWKRVCGDYFQTIGASLLRGRLFSAADGPASPLVVVIDESMARRYWPDSDPIGQRIKGQDKRGRNDDWVTIIGVVGDMHRHGLEREPTPHVFETCAQTGGAPQDLVARIAGNPYAIAAALRSEMRVLDRDVILSRVATLEDKLSDQLSPRRFQTWLLALFSMLALALAAMGIYGVMHYAVAQRTREIGIRMALGARAADVLRMIIGQGLALALAGVAVGWIAALWLTRLLASLLFGVQPDDLLTYASVSIVLLTVAAASSALPAWRAAAADPSAAIRHE